jgi:ribosomal protein L6P/L9E
LSFDFSPEVSVSVEEKQIIVTKNNDKANALWGTTRSIIDNMVV